MKRNMSLYMFALMPPDDVSLKMDLIRKDFSERFHFYKALKPPVHITLFDPFKIPTELSWPFEQYVSQLQYWAAGQSPFNIYLYNFNFFDNPLHPVVYIDVVKSSCIISFHSSFIKELEKYHLSYGRSGTYKPHVTIGYRDVTPEAFHGIKEYYSKQTFTGSFTCRTFYLWKHDGTNWRVVRTYFLEGKGAPSELF